jgi:thiol-disulfide isomerase/thioredoxin
MIKFVFLVIIFSMAVSSCVAPNQTFEKIPPGIWRGVLLLDRKPVQKYGDDRDIVKNFDIDSELPFNFEVIYDDSSNFHIVLHNGTERIKVENITFGRDRATAKDTVIINFPVYDTYIKAIYDDGVMEGEWIVNYKENYRIPFKASHGVADRYRLVSKDTSNISGKWQSKFELGTKDQYNGVGIFEQKGNIVTGTFLTETGDYRYLEGVMADKKLYLSAFDGAHAFLIQGKLGSDGKLGGIFRSGSQYTTNWEGRKDERSTLLDAYNLTKSVTDRPLNFKFLDTESKSVSIVDHKFNGKAKIIQIMGTWCPNCMDETIFLKDYFEKHPNQKLEWISLGFERYKDTIRSIDALKRFKTSMKLNHDILYAGYYDKKMASATIPQLDKILAYPTMIILDENNNIVKIHTGFSGPATPDFKLFEKEFHEMITSITN